MRLKDIKTKNIRIMGFQNVIPCNLVNRKQSVHKPVASIYLEDETAGYSEILVPIYQNTYCHNRKIISVIITVPMLVTKAKGSSTHLLI